MNENELDQDLLYRPAPILTILTVVGLGLFAILDALHIPGGIVGMIGVGVFDNGQRNQELVDLSVLIRGLSSMGQLLLFVFTPICFCMLMYRCAKNALALGFTGFSHTPGWVVGWYFVPFAHLIMPYKAIAEYWQSSKAKVDPETPPEWWDESVGFLLTAWWATWVFGTLLTNLSSKMSRSISFETIGMCVVPFAAILQVTSGLLCIMMVLKITKRQNQQALVVFATPSPTQGEMNHV